MDLEATSRCQFLDAREEGARLGHVLMKQELVQSLRIKFPRNFRQHKQPLDLGREGNLIRCLRVEKGLLSKPITGTKDDSSSAIVQDEREHTSQFIHHLRTRVLPQMREHLAVTTGAKLMPGTSELLPQFAVIVDFAITDNGDGVIFVEERLVTCRQVNNRQPRMPQCDRTIDMNRLSIGASML